MRINPKYCIQCLFRQFQRLLFIHISKEFHIWETYKISLKNTSTLKNYVHNLITQTFLLRSKTIIPQVSEELQLSFQDVFLVPILLSFHIPACSSGIVYHNSPQAFLM